MKMLSFLFLLMALPVGGYWQQAEPPTIFLVGDSTMADKPFKNGNPEKGWGQVLPLYLKEGIKVENHAVNGRSTKSFRDEGRWERVLQRARPGDYILIEFGHNDAKQQDPARYAAAETDYRQNLERFVREAREKGTKPVLATPIVRRKFNEQGELVETHGLYPEVVRQVAESHKVPLLDLHQQTRQLLNEWGEERSKMLFLHIEPGEYPALPEGEQDNTHLSPTGAFRVCDLAVAEMKQALPEMASYFKN